MSRLSPLSILRTSSVFSASTLVAFALNFPKSIIVASVLGPEQFGIIGFLALWSFYGSLVQPGVFDAAQREMPHLIGQGKGEEAIRVQNVGLTVTGTYTLLPMAVMFVTSFFFDAPLLRYGMMLTAISFGLSTTANLITAVHWAYQRFRLLAIIQFLMNTFPAILIMATVFWLGPYAVLAAPIGPALLALLIFAFRAPPIHLRLRWEKPETLRLFKIGLPLVLLNVFYWGFRTIDRTEVAAWLPMTEMGYYTFAMTFILLAISIVSDFGRILQPMLWTELGRQGTVRGLSGDIIRIAILMILATGLAINLSQAGFAVVVYWLLPQFVPSIPVFEILVFSLVLISSTIVPNLILNSAVVNKQGLNTVVWGCGTAVNAALIYAVIRAGLGPTGVAWSAIGAQMLVSVTLFFLVSKYLFASRKEGLIFGIWSGALLLASALTFAVFHLDLFSVTAQSNLLSASGLRLALALGVWGAIGAFFYRRWPGQLGFSRAGREEHMGTSGGI